MGSLLPIGWFCFASWQHLYGNAKLVGAPREYNPWAAVDTFSRINIAHKHSSSKWIVPEREAARKKA